MSLTIGGGPLARNAPKTVNYTLDSPAHSLFLHPFTRRVRAELGGQAVFDTDRGMLLHETSLLPALYVPFEDIGASLLTESGHTTHCPYKGDAAYWHLSIGGRTVENAVWAYPEPNEDASWLRGLASVYWDAADAWYDEQEQVHGHLRDPFHRVDARQAKRVVRVSWNGETIAVTDHPKVLSETGLPDRYYLAPETVRRDLLAPSRTTTYCPYKGRASYWGLRVGETEIADVAFSYTQPLKDAQNVREYLCFLHDDLTIEVG